ncbi:hypothetical protein [Streptomyces sp. NPDC001508]|uniref:hypothetical protein n=1 Tax=Streptomyces sp. NPDC001508 TaxID=3154656 RepID=UPI0033286F40
MPRGRHRHSPSLHRLLPPSAIAGVSLVCALGPWVSSDPMALRLVAAVAAATAFVGAAVMRRWDAQAGKQVADLTRARAGDEWRHEERVAELETDLEESRELRVKLEQRLRAKRAELAGLRNEHAALLRRYATAETERATALEGRRLLEIEAAPSPAPPPAPTGAQPEPARADAGRAAGERGVRGALEANSADGDFEKNEAVEGKQAAAGVFSPEGAQLFLRAGVALARLAGGGGAVAADEVSGADEADEVLGADEADEVLGADEAAAEEAAVADVASVGGSAAESVPEPAAGPGSGSDPEAATESASPAAPAPRQAPESAPKGGKQRRAGVTNTGVTDRGVTVEAEAAEARPSGGDAEHVRERAAGPVPEDEDQGQSEAVAGPEHATAVNTSAPAGSATPERQPSGHFTVPTAVAVVPATPARRPAVEGGFDFFGTQEDALSAPLDAVQNEDLADVVGQEALALHKAESEGGFKPADKKADDAGEVIDLTAHDETEQLDLHGLHSAAS